jgi:ATP-dependent helicase/nuclease subunit A
VLAMPGGQRRLANVRKLMRLARGAGQTKGSDLRAFLELVAERSGPAARGAAQESEAPVEGEALDAVRLMTIHGAKGLEFEIVCVADLGRSPWRDAPVVRIGADGRLGLRLARPGTGAREPALAYDVLSEEQRQAQEREERRLFYVAATRARERLVFSGAARIQEGVLLSGAPIGWLAPALVPDLTARLQRGELDGPSDGVRYSVLLPEHPATEPPDLGDGSPSPSVLAENPVPSHAASPSVPLPRALSYTALAEYSRCGYRYYVQRVLGLPPVEVPGAPSDLSAGAGASALSGVERGTILHALLERLDFRRPVAPGPEAVAAAAGRSLSPESVRELTELVETFATSRLSARLAQADRVHREQPFGFLLDETLITGVFDVIATTHDGDALVVDYKSDRLEGGDPVALVGERYATQRLVYALAALRSGAERVEVAHVFLERPEQPISVAYERSGLLALERELRALVAGVVAGRFAVSDTPHRGLCSECPAEGGLCSWPLSMTRRDAPDRLF